MEYKAYYISEKKQKQGLAFLAYGRDEKEAIKNHCERNGFKVDYEKYRARLSA